MTQSAFTAPHEAAARLGQQLLREGHNAIDAMIAAAAAITVLYPHMNSLGGDGFWLVHIPGEKPFAIDACGRAAGEASLRAYRELGYEQVPGRGANACITVGGAVSGWQAAREAVKHKIAKQAPLHELLEPAKSLAKDGVIVSTSLARASAKLLDETANSQSSPADRGDFHSLFTPQGRALEAGLRHANPALADIFEQLAYAGLHDFYRGDLGHTLAAHLEKLGSPLRINDLQAHRAELVNPLQVALRAGRAYNLPAPTQGAASLLILAIYDRLYRADLSEAEHIHLLVEATKQAFQLRDRYLCDPDRMSCSSSSLLADELIDRCAKGINARAKPWPQAALPGDTVWMGCVDQKGVMVSYIQSTYWEFGAGVVLPGTGIVYNNRGAAFNLQQSHHNALTPGAKPLHTLNPAYAQLKDGRRVVYGTMGGEGQPQTQAAIFTRSFYRGEHPAAAIERGRWLLGRTWGDESSDLKIEEDLWEQVGKKLLNKGHRVTMVPRWSEVMGHAGALVLHRDGKVEGASDPRSDGAWFGG